MIKKTLMFALLLAFLPSVIGSLFNFLDFTTKVTNSMLALLVLLTAVMIVIGIPLGIILIIVGVVKKNKNTSSEKNAFIEGGIICLVTAIAFVISIFLFHAIVGIPNSFMRM